MVDASELDDTSPPSDPPPSSASGPKVTREEVEEKLRTQPWELLSKELFLFATRNLFGPKETVEQDAHDFVQEALLRLRDPARNPWNFRKQPSLWTFLVGIILRLITHKHHSKAVQMYGGSYDESDTEDGFRVAGPYEDAQELLLRQEEERIKGEMLLEVRAQLEQERDELAVTVMTLFEQGFDSVLEQVTKTRATEDEVKKARRRLREVGLAVMAARRKAER